MVRYRNGRAYLSDIERAAERNAVSPIAVLEVQGFRGPKDNEVIFTAYAHQGGEVMGIDRAHGDRRRFGDELLEQPGVRGGRGHRAGWGATCWSSATSRAPRPLAPSTSGACPSTGTASSNGSRFFNRYRGGYYASNPTVSPDGKTVAFQLSFDGPVEGAGQGILLFDLEKYEEAR